MPASGKLALDGGTPAITEPIPSGGHGVELIDDREIEAVAGVLRSRKLFRYYEGSQCELFEKEVCAWLNVKHAVFLNSGTSALICGLAGLQVGPGDEVIVPAYTYIASAAAIVGVGAIPIIAEIDDSLGLDPADLRRKITRHTKAVIPVHMQGVPCKLDEIRRVAREHSLAVVEDCCQAVGSSYRGKPTGSESHGGAWSFNYYKSITTSEGGVFFTSDPDVFERALFQSEPGLPMWLKDRTTWRTPPFSRAGYRGNEILAAIARVQLTKLPQVLEHCRRLKRTLLESLKPPKCYVRQHVDDPAGDNGISFAMIVRTPQLAKKLAEALGAEGLGVGSAYNDGFPDRHVYTYWDSILNRNGATAAGYPWADPSYKGTVNYSKDMCPKSLDILSRALRIGINMKTNETHVRQIAQAINKVDAALG
ncbi:MAG TPA: DegT/DnrJ/EryC1/StrS family aminotransferase [Planctomycetota bacterium]|nr:DegT/DnrJ/EryC1/StrS family aminotransferase [Planctomycetota bacterium]